MKAHLGTIRKGWQNENLARYILSRFAFLSQPTTVADDIGSDFFCTIFQTKSVNSRDYLIPKNSFAIQIKSSGKTFSISNKLQYLQGLEIPFFVGVCSQTTLELTLYSGEYLIPFFVSVETPRELKVSLCERDVNNDFFQDDGNGNHIIKFPKITTIRSDVTKSELSEKVRVLLEVCKLISKNIANRNNREYVFDEYESSRLLIPFNEHSVKQSLDKRFEKIMTELAWLLDEHPNVFHSKEIQIYQNLLTLLIKINPSE